MAGARVIKLSFWTDGEILKLPIEARLVYQAVWAWCDDQGIGPANVEDFHVRMFPRDIHLDIAGHVASLIAAKRIVVFQDDHGDRYWWVPTFHKHQKIDQITPQYPQPSRETVVSSLGEKRAEQWFETIRGRNRKAKREAWQGKGQPAGNRTEAGPEPAEDRPPQRTENRELRTENLPPPNPPEGEAAPLSLVPRPIERIPHEVSRQVEQYVGRPLGDKEVAELLNLTVIDPVPAEWWPIGIADARAKSKFDGLYLCGIVRRYRRDGGPRERAGPAPTPKPARTEIKNWLYGTPEDADRLAQEEYGNDRSTRPSPPRASPAA